MPGRCCFPRVTHSASAIVGEKNDYVPATTYQRKQGRLPRVGGLSLINYNLRLSRSGLGCMQRSRKCVTRRKQERPGNASNDNTAHMPTARSSADLTKPNHTPTRHTLTKDKIILQTATPQAASSQRIHISRTQGRGRTHPVTGPPSACTHRASQPVQGVDATTAEQ